MSTTLPVRLREGTGDHTLVLLHGRGADENDLLGLFDDLAATGRTVVVITHEDEVAGHAKRIIRMNDGRIVSDDRQVGVDEPPPRAQAVGAR